ncbi:MAG: glycoside hydrolase family 3 C-terminal domain-containing protein [Lachnospiraceae bacterium]|nr:glycoside hydrolase family 3 C-terminal domain-containing protein [Lachnospiraceae bacterium]
MITNERIKEIVNELTLDEKISMVHGTEFFKTAGVPRLNIPPLVFSDGPMGVRLEYNPADWDRPNLSDDYVTYLPCNSALASTFNRELAFDTGSVLGEEARGRGKDVILGPGVNIKRSPLCGRNFEYFSEDPYLAKELAVEYVKGVQQWDVAACVKHFLANNQEVGRLEVDTIVDEEVLREIYMPAFYDAMIRGGAYSIMGSYNRINGKFGSQHTHYLNDVVRDEWGYDGLIVSDWGAVHDSKEAAESGLDVEMSVTPDFDDYYMANPLKKLVESGEVSEELIDKKVEHCLILMNRLNMLDGERKPGAYNTWEHQQKALKVAEESIVLLKNDKAILPLDKKIDKLLIIGENGERLHALGGGSAELKALYEISPLMGIKKLLGGNTEVKYVKGYSRDIYRGNLDEKWQEKSLDMSEIIHVDNDDEAEKKMSELRVSLRKEALEAAKEYDHIIYVGGSDHVPGHDSEGDDRKDINLPYEQDILIKELLKIRPDMVIVLTAGSVLKMSEWIDDAHAVLWGWYGGMEGGTAIAEVLFGDVNPSGRLPETFYKDLSQCSAHAIGEYGSRDRVEYKDGIYVGYRYVDKFGETPQFPFGYGLSYTTFECEQGSVDLESDAYNCSVKNTGSREGKVSVLVYMKGKQDEPEKVLVGFEKVTLAPGEKKLVRVDITDGVIDGREYFAVV